MTNSNQNTQSNKHHESSTDEQQSDGSGQEPEAWAFTVIPQTPEGVPQADPFEKLDFDHPSKTGYGKSDGFLIENVRPLYTKNEQ